MEDSITYVGMDTHKKQHKVALIYPGQDEIIEFSIKNTVVEIRKMIKKIKQTKGVRPNSVRHSNCSLAISHSVSAFRVFYGA